MPIWMHLRFSCTGTQTLYVYTHGGVAGTTNNYTNSLYMFGRIFDKLLFAVFGIIYFYRVCEDFSESNVPNIAGFLFMWCALGDLPSNALCDSMHAFGLAGCGCVRSLQQCCIESRRRLCRRCLHGAHHIRLWQMHIFAELSCDKMFRGCLQITQAKSSCPGPSLAGLE